MGSRDTRDTVIAIVGGVIASGIFAGIVAVAAATHNVIDGIFLGVALVCGTGLVYQRRQIRRLEKTNAAHAAADNALTEANTAAGNALTEANKGLDALRVRNAELTQEIELFEKWRGIEEATGLEGFRTELGGSDMHPREAIEAVQRNLDFMGHGASKWSAQVDQMAAMLLRLSDTPTGRVRMLVLNPVSDICQSKSRVRYPHDPGKLPRKILTSLQRLEALAKIHDNLHIKLYDHEPIFRLTIIDHDLVIVGHYRNYLRGSEATPLLVINARFDWTFYLPFNRLFEAEWEAAADVDWEMVHDQADEYGCVVS